MASSLSSSVTSLSTSLHLLDSSISTLSTGVADLPRLSSVLATTRHFELLPESTLQAAQKSLLGEIVPGVERLLKVAAEEVEKVERREEGLRARSELLEGRLGKEEVRRRSLAGGTTATRKGSFGGGIAAGKKEGNVGGGEKATELKRLRREKERLKYAVERLELQGKQRERELRKSMAAVR
ncbi:MAG: hypothetical protein Q9227_001224 [Pyrenula ochraceoflavens]